MFVYSVYSIIFAYRNKLLIVMIHTDNLEVIANRLLLHKQIPMTNTQKIDRVVMIILIINYILLMFAIADKLI